jgi:hypothetical protein
MSNINIKVGGNVGGEINVSEKDIVIANGKRVTNPTEKKPCFFCNQPVKIYSTCPHCGGPYTERH